jgi:hypothetical protein
MGFLLYNTPMTPQQQENIDNIIENFDFDKVHRVMVFMDWKWAFSVVVRVPSIDELKDEARRLLGNLVENNNRFTECGGLRAEKYKKDDYFRLSFCIDSWEEYTEPSDEAEKRAQRKLQNELKKHRVTSCFDRLEV